MTCVRNPPVATSILGEHVDRSQFGLDVRRNSCSFAKRSGECRTDRAHAPFRLQPVQDMRILWQQMVPQCKLPPAQHTAAPTFSCLPNTTKSLAQGRGRRFVGSLVRRTIAADVD